MACKKWQYRIKYKQNRSSTHRQVYSAYLFPTVNLRKHYFVFKLNLDCYDVIMQVEGRKNKFTTSLRESPRLQDSSSGSYQ